MPHGELGTLFKSAMAGYWVGNYCQEQVPENLKLLKYTYTESLWMGILTETNQMRNSGGLSIAQYYSENICYISVCIEQVFYTRVSDDSENK